MLIMDMAHIRMAEAGALSMECESYPAMRQAARGHGEFAAHEVHGCHCARDVFAVLVPTAKMTAIEYLHFAKAKPNLLL
jgi:hypothetical protein